MLGYAGCVVTMLLYPLEGLAIYIESARTTMFVGGCRSADRQSIGLGGRPEEQAILLFIGILFGDYLEGIPDRAVAACCAVRRIIALEHAALCAERFDAAFNIGLPGSRQVGRGTPSRFPERMQIHAQSAHLDDDVRPSRHIANGLTPCGKEG